ncbi:unnamed protein product [Urochloa humidicola]
MDLTLLLPEDVLADVLGRLAPRWLAASRRVCHAWRAAIDGRGLLRDAADLLPRSLAGIFIQHSSNWMTSFLCRPSAAGRPASADLHYTFSGDGGGKEIEDSFEVRDHCNGLVLLQDVVANPATRRWARLPPCPPPPCAGPDHGGYFYVEEYLTFDPAVSPHYEVFSVPRVRHKVELKCPNELDPIPSCWEEVGWPTTYKNLDPALEGLEWPPSPCALHVFSSRTGKWEERSFCSRRAGCGDCRRHADRPVY